MTSPHISARVSTASNHKIISSTHFGISFLDALENKSGNDTPSSFRSRTSKHAEAKTRNLKGHQVDGLKSELVECCLSHVQDSYRVHLNRLKGLSILETLIAGAPIHRITPESAMHMLWASVSCVHHFALRVKPERHGIMQIMRKRQAKRALKVYEKLITFLISNYFSILFSALITFFEEAGLWELEYFCASLFIRLLINVEVKQRDESVAHLALLNKTTMLASPETGRHIFDIIYLIFDSVEWVWVNENLIEHIMFALYQALITLEQDSSHDSPVNSIVKHLDIMIVHLPAKKLLFMMQIMLQTLTQEEFTNGNILIYGTILEKIAAVYTQQSQDQNLIAEIFPLLLKIISSQNFTYSLLGNRILHNLLDRCDNKKFLQKPRIFFRNLNTMLKINQFNVEDKVLFQKYRQFFHRVILESVVRHGIHSNYIQNIFTTISLLVIEIPCSYTASAAICVSMAIQEAALKTKEFQLVQTHRIHAMIVSVVSLVCYVHKASVFYDYVDRIIEKRANFAPHLNPPLRLKYKYAQHHVLWDKRDLFFEDWETRYGLWRCFKNRHKDIVMINKNEKMCFIYLNNVK